ncbi:MAG TPA: enoyl-CoA hydratase-related protein [Gammaproteobacteria bacterium]|nr:enoyl-CoA hydratase-related protein [Gammaproteobacteria bacterium]
MSLPQPPSAPAYDTLRLERQEAVDWLTLNRPDRLNALSNTMIDELQDYFGRLQQDHATRVVVMRGAGRAFCAGLDLKDPLPTGQSPAGGMRGQRRVSEIMMRMRRCPQAIVALVNGAASGGGFALALAADVRIAAEDARMNVAFIRIGLSGCDVGVSYFLPRMVGTSLAAELMLTGRLIDAQRALRTGLVSEVVSAAELTAAGEALVADMLATSPLGLRLTKEGLNMSVDAPSLEAAVAMEDRQQILCAASGDFREGVDAFLDKREPRYRDD